MSTKREKNPRFEVYGTAVGAAFLGVRDWRWRLLAKNGEIIASGEGFTREKDARRAVAAVKRAVLAITAQESLDGAVKVLSKGAVARVGDAAKAAIDAKRVKFFGKGTRGRPS